MRYRSRPWPRKAPSYWSSCEAIPAINAPPARPRSAELRKHASEFKELGSNVVLVYPGAVDDLQLRANQFLKDTNCQSRSCWCSTRNTTSSAH